MNFLPSKFDKRWGWILLVLTGAVYCVLVLSRAIFLRRQPTLNYMGSMLILSLLVSLITTAFGFFNAKIVFAFGIIGLIVGSTMMAIAFTSNTGWEDLVGMIQFQLIFLSALVVGVIVQIISYLIRNIKKSR